jgi:HlyD family secretion protein
MRFRSMVSSAVFLLTTAHLAAASPQATIEDVFCPTEGKRNILYIVPEGASVTKGQLVCLLGAGGSRASIEHQHITTKQAEAAYAQSRLSREVAEVAAREYEEGTFNQELEMVNADIALAQVELQRASDRLEWKTRLLPLRPVSPAQELSDRLAMNKARFTLEQTNTSKKVFLEFTKPKRIKELRTEVEKARAEERSMKATYEREKTKYELEKAKHEGLRREASKVQVLAPIDGSVRLARPTRLVEEGAEISEGQLILRVVPDSKGAPAKP